MDNNMKIITSQKKRKFYFNADGVLIYAECTRCKKTLPIEMFNKQAKGPYGVRSICKQCKKETRSKLSEDAKKRKKEYDKKWRENNKERLQRIDKYKNTKHNPVIYKISFEKYNSVYIGKTVNLGFVTNYHIRQAKKHLHCDFINDLYINDYTYFKECVKKIEVIKRFSEHEDKHNINIYKCNEQIKQMCNGYNVLGQTGKDLIFTQYLIELIGGTNEIVNRFKDVLIDKLK